MLFIELAFLLAFFAVIVWAGRSLLALLPGDERLKQAARIILILGISLWILSVAAQIFGVAVPWNLEYHRHR